MTVILAFDCLNLSFAITDHVRTGFPGAFPCFIGFKEHCPGVLPIVPDFSKSQKYHTCDDANEHFDFPTHVQRQGRHQPAT
jgi:hypothetical protein